MNMIRKTVGVMFVAICALLALTGCDEAFDDLNENEEEPECFEDEDCGDSEVCYGEDGDYYEAQTCVALCEETDACGTAEVCRDRDDFDAEDTICLGPPEQCSEHDECPNDWFCDTEAGEEDGVGECVDTTEINYYTVLIEDATRDHGDHSDGDRCTDTTAGYETAGAKIYDVILFDEDTGEEYAHIADFYPGDNADFGDPYTIFDGTAPDFEHMCPDPETYDRLDNDNEVTSTFHEDAVVALGCDGQLLLQFKDDDGNLIELHEGHQVEVYSYGQQCSDEFQSEHGGTFGPQSKDDPYFVDICTDATPDGPIDVDTCDVTLTADPAFGFSFIDVELPW